MVSKNNLHLKQTKTADQTPHYGLRKLSVGVASVLLSTTLYLGATAQADTVPTGDESQSPATSAVVDSSSSTAGTLTIAQNAGSTANTQSTTDSATSQATSGLTTVTSQNIESTASAAPVSESTADSQSVVANNASVAVSPTVESASSASSAGESSATTTLDLSSMAADSVSDSALTASLATSTAGDTTAHSLTLQYYDVVNDKTIAEKVVQSEKGSSTDIDFPLPEGYTYVVDSSDLQMPAKWEPGTSSTTNITYQVPIYRKEDLTRTITRTINIHKPTGTEAIKQSVVYVSKVSILVGMLWQDFMAVPSSLPLKDKTENFYTWSVDGPTYSYYKVTVSAAKADGSADWAEYTVPTIDGYTASQLTVPKVTTTANDSDQTVDITYKQNAKSTVEFVDDDNNGAVVGTPVVLNGYADDVKPVSMTLPANYELASGQTIPASVTLSGADDTVQIHLKHQVQTIADDDPMNHTAFQVTVHYKKDGQTDTFMPDTVITTKYKRTTTKDLVTGKYTATPFVLESITQTGTKIDGLGTPAEGVVKDVPKGWQYFTYNIPYNISVPGWHSTHSNASFTDTISLAPGTSTTMGTHVLTAVYAANTQTTHVKYVDANGTVVKTDTISGKTGTTQTVNSTVPTGWKMTTPQTIPTSVTFDEDGVPDTTITIEHDHVAVSHDNPQTTGTQIPNGATTFKGVADSDLNKTVTRTVTIISPDGKTKTTTQTFTSTRDAVVDMVDGSVVYSDWTQGKWDAVDVPTYDHYTASQTSVPEQTVDGSTADSTVNVTYTANTETVTVQWVDDTENGKVVYSTNVSLQPGKKTAVWVFGLDENRQASTDAVALSDMYNLVSVSDTNVLQSINWPGYYDVFDLVMPSVDNWIDGNTYTVHLTHKISATDGYSSPTNTALRTTNSKRYPNLMYTDDAAWNKTHKDVLRTITVVEPNGLKLMPTQKQKLAFSRQAQYDMVTGEFKGYTDWKEGTQTFAAYTPAAIAGYTAETVPTATVTGDSDNLTATVGYTANAQTAKIVYVDKDGNTIKTDTVNGVTDQTVDTNSTVPAGWRLSTGQTVPTTIKLGVNTPDTKVIIEHDHVTVTSDKPQADGTDIPGGVAKFKGVTESDLNQTITRTIHVNDPYSGGTAITQTAKISRSATVDMVDGSVVYGDWSTAEWPEYTAPTVGGYTPSQATVESKTVANGDKDDTVMINYTANAQTAHVVYVDKDGNTIKTDTVKGVTDQTVDVKSTVPTGWKLANGQTIPATIKLGVNTPDAKIIAEHDHVTVAPDKPQADGTQIPNGATTFKGVSDSDLNQTLTRTITVNDPHTGVKTITQTAKIYRDATVDMVDGSVVYGEWSTAEWPEYTVPTVDGYTPSQKTVEKKTVVNGDQDDAVEINYTANAQTAHVVYVDKDGNTIKTDTINGVADQTVDTNSTVPTGWKLANGQTVPTTIKLGVNTPDTKVIIEHDHVTVAPDKPQVDGTQIPNGAAKFKGVSDNDLNQTLTRTIMVNDPHTGVKTITQTAKIYRDAVVDMVDGSVVYGEWSTAEWPEYTVPTVDGYTPSQATVKSKTVANGDQDDAVTIDYTANVQTAKIVYIDKDGNTIKTDTINGVTDQDAKVNNSVPTGWKLVDGQTVPTTIKLGVNTPDTVVKVEHNHVSISHDNPQANNTDIPGGTAKFSGVDDSDLNQTLTRTITVNDPHTGVKTITQTAKLYRDAVVDMVDGSVAYGDWSTAEWPEYTVPTVGGYTPSQTTVESKTVANGDKDDTVTINYTADKQTAHVVYVDQNGNQIKSDDVDGHTDETVKVTSKVPAGWVLADGQSVPESITFGATTPDAKVVVKHGHVAVTPDAPKTSSDKLPDNPVQSYPSGVDYNDLNKTITRTINVHNLDGTVTPIVQTAHLTRTADVDEVDGTVTYGEWTTGSWDKFVSTPIDGYTASLTELPETEVGFATADTSFDVIYTANNQSMRINYVDENGQTVDSTIVNGHTDETVTTNSKVPAGWKLVDGQNVPAEITFKGAKTDDATVKVEHAHVTVTPDAPKTISDKLPDNADKNYPSGVGYGDLNKTITRTIEIDEPNGNIIFVPKQEVHYTRTADVDEVSGTVTYGEWTTKDQFTEFANIPAFAGYTPSQAKVDAVVPSIGDSDSTVKITYAANEQSMQIVYVDENGQTVKADTVKGYTDETVATNSTVPAGWTTESVVPTEITFKGAKTADVTIKVKHAHITVTPDAPKTVSDKLPDNVDKNYPSGVDYNNLNKTVKRTIVVHNVDGTTTTVEQEVHFTRTADVDEVDGTVEYGSWQADKQFDQYAVPVVPGYVSMIDGKEQTMIQPETPNVDDNDLTIDVTYQAVDGSQTIDYVDENNTVIGYQIITGKTAETKPVKSAVPAGWKLVDGQTVPATVTIKANDVPVKVSIEHDHVAVSHDNAQKDGTRIPNGAAVFNGVADNDLNQTLTRTITINDPHESVKTITQTAKIYRDAVVNMVDGSVVYGDWSTAEWPEYTVPTVDGYTPSQATVGSKTVANGDKDDAVTIDYTANEQTAKIVYVDENGQTVKSDTVAGVTDQDAKVNSSVPTGWKLVDGQTIPTTIKLGVNTPDTTIKVEHDHVSISHDNPQANGIGIPGGVAKFNGVADNDLNQTLTRTITINDPHEGVKTITQTAKIYRDAVVDMVDGTVKYGEWSTAEWPEYVVPTVDGYTPSQATVAEKQVANGDQDANVVVDYTADSQTAKIVYVDENGQTVKTDTVAGVTDQDAKVDSSVPTGWKLIDGQTIPTTIKLGVNTPDTTIKVQHDHVSISHDKPQTNGTDIPGGTAKFNGVSDTDLNQTLTRTITVNDPHEGVKATVQTAKIYRDAVVDMVDGSVVYGDWSTAEWPEYVTPIIAGYTPSQVTVEKKTVANGDQDDAVTIDYTADQQTAKIVYVDENGNAVKTDSINGVTDQTVKTNSFVPTGWKLIDGQTIPTTIKLGVNTPDTTIKVEHNHVSINHDKPQINGTDIPGGTAKFNGVADNDLNQTLTRTITINDPHEGVKTIAQTAKIYRDAVVDMVDGTVKYGEWSTAEWPEYNVPMVDGYTPSQATVESKTVANGDKDDAVMIGYKADDQTAKIVYVDENGQTVKTDTVAGVTDQDAKVDSSVPTGWKLVDGQTMPVKIKLDANTPDVMVKVEHNHVSINHDNSQVDGTNIPGGAVEFKGVADNDLNQTLTRTIIVKLPNGQTKALAQTAKLYRDAVVDMVDGSVEYSDWSTTQWNEYAAPDVDGYTPSQKMVLTKPVVNGMQNETVTIDYTANDGTQTINYVDEDGNVIVKQTIHGKTDQEVAVNDDKPHGWVLEDGQKVPGTVTIKTADEPITVKIKHGIVAVAPDAPKTDADRMPNWPDKGYPTGVGYDDLNKTVTRTITFELPDGQTKTVKQTTTFTRHATVDEVTNAVVYSAWNEQSHTFDTVDVPTIDGWTSNAEQVNSVVVTPDSEDEQVTIAYTANPTAPKSEDKSAGTAEQSEGAADTANGSANSVFNESATVQGNAKADSQTKVNSQAKTDELPQTGNEQTNLQAIAGLAMTGLAAMLGLGRKKRKNS